MLSKEFWIGVGAFGLLLIFSKPAKKLAAGIAGTALLLADRGKEFAQNVKEEVEDIVVEAQYQHTMDKSKKEIVNE